MDPHHPAFAQQMQQLQLVSGGGVPPAMLQQDPLARRLPPGRLGSVAESSEPQHDSEIPQDPRDVGSDELLAQRSGLTQAELQAQLRRGKSEPFGLGLQPGLLGVSDSQGASEMGDLLPTRRRVSERLREKGRVHSDMTGSETDAAAELQDHQQRILLAQQELLRQHIQQQQQQIQQQQQTQLQGRQRAPSLSRPSGPTAVRPSSEADLYGVDIEGTHASSFGTMSFDTGLSPQNLATSANSAAAALLSSFPPASPKGIDQPGPLQQVYAQMRSPSRSPLRSPSDGTFDTRMGARASLARKPPVSPGEVMPLSSSADSPAQMFATDGLERIGMTQTVPVLQNSSLDGDAGSSVAGPSDSSMPLALTIGLLETYSRVNMAYLCANAAAPFAPNTDQGSVRSDGFLNAFASYDIGARTGIDGDASSMSTNRSAFDDQPQGAPVLNLNNAFQAQPQLSSVPSAPQSGHSRRLSDGNHSLALYGAVPTGSQPNLEVDDENHELIMRPGDVVNDRYVVASLLGRGSFGQVVRVFDRVDREYVALKVIKSKPRFYQQGLIEVQLLDRMHQRNLAGTFGVVRAKTHFVTQGHLCIVFELLSHSLYDVLRQTNFEGVSLSLVAKFAFQLVHALYFLSCEEVDVVHCDLKPENVLLQTEKHCVVKLIDFGSSCRPNQRIYNYIQSRFYRAPEVILELGYSHPIDIWSLACIISEMHTGQPLFAGGDEKGQLEMIASVKGPFPVEMIQDSPQQRKFFMLAEIHGLDGGLSLDWCIKDPTGLPPRDLYSTVTRGKTVTDDNSARYAQLVDLLDRMTMVDPRLRITASDALRHPFIMWGQGLLNR